MDSKVADRYAKNASSYDRSWSWYAEKSWAEALPLFPPLAGKWVLDAGCGTGLLTDRLANEVGAWGQVVGIDLCQEMIEKAQGRLSDRRNVSLHRAPLHQSPARDHSFDVVVCSSVLHHVDDLGPVLREWRRVLNSGGEVVLIDWDGAAFPMNLAHSWWKITDSAYRKSWKQSEVETALRNHGFAVLESKKASLSGFWKVWLIRAKKEG